ncbi:NADH-quinone oxidoreductase subunit N [Candidatus Endolissoclinum faulkneri L2]|uniref:NADH-quinone oxidoreductase subunit N n=1 Tax=Candidatus Endolissoclinum faulkneri L2 TaxID=1193729 RepID=K7ZCP6_9PROT|nr:NADH-quinone oxidoreductase subunit NuoN [Candidatus Endolissoclinum faulkneri]AFX98781.1 NADH-quinone oxidoreductase subunit N [Candidatus Endolissoclinum faulkneri L2]
MNLTTTLPIIAPASAEIFLAISGLILLMAGLFINKNTLKIISYSTIAILLVTATLVLIQSENALAFQALFISDSFARFIKVLIIIGVIFSIIMSFDYLKRSENNLFEYPILILFATLGMMLMVSSNNLILLYMSMELQSIALYVLATIQRNTLKSTEAGLKYFVLGAFSSGILLYGCSIIYGFTGTTSFNGIATVVSTSRSTSVGLIIGLIFLFSGLAFKVSIVPFHMWAPDVYEGAPTPVTALFTLAPKIAALALFLRVMLDPFRDLLISWQPLIVFLSIASVLVGGLAAIMQTNIKRLIAYSSIAHMGYSLIGLASGNETGVTGILMYLTTYTFTSIGIFSFILCMRRNDSPVENISDLTGLSDTHPMMALALMIFMLSMSGIPPLAGFFGKWFVFISAIDAGLYVLATIGILSSVISAFYYLRIIKIMYFEKAAQPLDAIRDKKLQLTLCGSAMIIVFFFFAITPVYNTAISSSILGFNLS